MPDYQWLANFGFAAVVAMFVLLRLETAIRELTRTVNTLALLVAKSTGQNLEEARKLVNGRRKNDD